MLCQNAIFMLQYGMKNVGKNKYHKNHILILGGKYNDELLQTSSVFYDLV